MAEPASSPQPQSKVPKITLVGQSQSGKTNLLATLIQNTKAWSDVKDGWNGITDISVSNMAESGSPAEADMNVLEQQYKAILSGRDFNAEGSEQVRYFPLALNHVERKKRPKRTLGIRTGGTRIDESTDSLAFEVIDGRGGDIVPVHYLDPNDEENQVILSRRDEYRTGLDESVGILVCMPISDKEFDFAMANRLVKEILETKKRRGAKRSQVKLERVALCFTKYDLLFDKDGAQAGLDARDKDVLISQLHGQAMLDCFRPLFSEANNVGTNLEVLIFPSSTLGFIDGTGPANFYNYEPAPGLLTRIIDPDVDYDESDLQPYDETLPKYKDHFPFEMTDQTANSLWQPFNISPPVLFALTGRRTGPIFLEPHEFD